MEACAWLPPLTLWAFPFAGSALHLLTVIDQSFEYDYTLSPVSPPSESQTRGCGLRVPQTSHLKTKTASGSRAGHLAPKSNPMVLCISQTVPEMPQLVLRVTKLELKKTGVLS